MAPPQKALPDTSSVENNTDEDSSSKITDAPNSNTTQNQESNSTRPGISSSRYPAPADDSETVKLQAPPRYQRSFDQHCAQ
jgi:hypothetical protein